ncbi:MAG: phage major tail tube protein [Roseibium sp.]|nr:phage major tail tube protein [Roseibium sp.]
MRHILQGFTMFIDGEDFGYDTEEIEIPIPTPVTQDYRGGGMDLGVTTPIAAIQALEITVKMAGHSPDIMKKLARGPGQTSRVIFRGSVLAESNSGTEAHVCVVEGSANGGSRDRWQRGEKSGLEFIINGILYFRYEADNEVIHELQAWPPKRIVNGLDQIASINRDLGY